MTAPNLFRAPGAIKPRHAPGEVSWSWCWINYCQLQKVNDFKTIKAVYCTCELTDFCDCFMKRERFLISTQTHRYDFPHPRKLLSLSISQARHQMFAAVGTKTEEYEGVKQTIIIICKWVSPTLNWRAATTGLPNWRCVLKDLWIQSKASQQQF